MSPDELVGKKLTAKLSYMKTAFEVTIEGLEFVPEKTASVKPVKKKVAPVKPAAPKAPVQKPAEKKPVEKKPVEEDMTG